MSFERSQETPPQRVPTTPKLNQFQNDFAQVVPEASAEFDNNGRVNERIGLEEQINRFNQIVYQHSPSGDTISSLSTHQSSICGISEDATDSQSQMNQSPIITSCRSIGSSKNSGMENESQIFEKSERELRADKPKENDVIVLVPSGNSAQKRQITQLESESCSKYLWDDSEPVFSDTGSIFFDPFDPFSF